MAEIYNDEDNTLLSGTSSSDSIYNTGNSVTINTGAGNDSVGNYYGNLVTINTGAGNDEVYNWGGDSVTINTGAGDDTVGNYGDRATINTGAGNDYVWNANPQSTIECGAGNDLIGNVVSYSTLLGGDGNDTIENGFITYNAIYGGGNSISIVGGKGKDSIFNIGVNVTIDGGKGNDSIFNNCWLQDDSSVYYRPYNDGNNVLFKYSSGDGNDIIYGFDYSNTLSISGGSYSTAKSGDDVIVTVDDGKISLIGAASLSSVNIDGEEIPIETNSWKLSGTTATYGTTSKTLATVKGVKSLDGLSVDGKTVTVSNASLNKKAVTISGTGYTLKLGSDVTKSSTTKNSWSMKDSTTATYKQTKSAYYTIASNKITYHKSTSGTLTTVKGVKSTSGLSVSGKTVTVSNASLNKKAVTITGTGYKLALGSDVTKSTSTAAKWSLSGTTATYKSAKKTTGYKLASNKISYVTASGGSTLATVKGVKDKSKLSVDGKIITATTAALNKKVTVSGNYEFDFAAGDYKKTSITGTANADTIKVLGTNAIVTGGKGNDSLVSNSSGGNIFVYSSGDGNDVITNFAATDKLSIKSAATYSVSGSDVVFTVGTGSITVKDAKDKTFTYYDSGGEKTYKLVDEKPYTISSKGVSVTLTSAYSEEKFSVNDVTGGSKIVTIDASAVTHAIEVKGNSKANKIIGSDAGGTLDGGSGKVNDTLIGGKGKDVFIYYDGDGNDVISGYEENDTIKIAEGTVSSLYTSRENVVFKIGTGKLTIQDAKETRITYIENGIEYGCLDGKKTFTITTKNDKTTATLAKNYWKDSFDVTSFGNEDVGSSITRIDAAKVTRTIKITGNDSANEIIAGKGDSTLIGGKGDDSIYGDDGKKIYVYKDGDGDDRIFNYGDSDKVNITTAGSVKVTTSGENVVFTVGKGKITLVDVAAKSINYVVNGNAKTTLFSSDDSADDMWFLDDDAEFISADNQLSSLVRDGAINYSVMQTNNSFALTTARLEQELIATPTPLKTLSKNFSEA